MRRDSFRNHIPRTKSVLSFSPLIFCVVLLGLPSIGSAAEAHSPISFRIILASRNVVAGTPIRAEIVITNSSSRSVSMGSTCPGQELQVGLSNRHIKFVGISGAVACRGLYFSPGQTIVKVTISTSYEMCGGRGMPARSTSGTCPNLPKGTYQTDMVTQGFPKGTKSPAAIPIVLR